MNRSKGSDFVYSLNGYWRNKGLLARIWIIPSRLAFFHRTFEERGDGPG
jgi:hypothetical protein